MSETVLKGSSLDFQLFTYLSNTYTSLNGESLRKVYIIGQIERVLGELVCVKIRAKRLSITLTIRRDKCSIIN